MSEQPGVRFRLWLWLAALGVAVTTLAGCQAGPTAIPKPARTPTAASTGPTADPTAPPATRPTWSSSPDQVAAARAALPTLQVRQPQLSNADYRRAAFGAAWTDTDGNGCNQRDDVLLRDVDTSAPFHVARQRGCDHDVVSGTWVDPYTGTSITLNDAKSQQQAPLVQVDHIVALSVAWRDGARAWTDAQRLTFANDLSNLVASSGEANQTKGGADAASWRPAPHGQCGYAVRYVTVKQAYALSVTPAESRALAQMLDSCG